MDRKWWDLIYHLQHHFAEFYVRVEIYSSDQKERTLVLENAEIGNIVLVYQYENNEWNKISARIA